MYINKYNTLFMIFLHLSMPIWSNFLLFLSKKESSDMLTDLLPTCNVVSSGMVGQTAFDDVLARHF